MSFIDSDEGFDAMRFKVHDIKKMLIEGIRFVLGTKYVAFTEDPDLFIVSGHSGEVQTDHVFSISGMDKMTIHISVHGTSPAEPEYLIDTFDIPLEDVPIETLISCIELMRREKFDIIPQEEV